MAKFSQRMGIEQINEIIQIDSINEELRNSLWSAFYMFYCKKPEGNHLPNNEILYDLCFSLWMTYFKYPIDNLRNDYRKVVAELKSYFFNCKWYDVYNFIEFVAIYSSSEKNKRFFYQNL